jgi:aminopeptidase YwaD
MKKAILFVAAAVLVLLLVPAVALATPTYDQAVNGLIAKHYPQKIENHLNSLGTSPLGFRWAGSASDNAASQYLATKMRQMGLSNVRLEKVPLDVFQPEGASVTVDREDMPSWTITCSQFAGVPPTPAEGITGEVVYAGAGTAADFEGLDVTGKIVLIDLALDEIAWLDMPAQEATVKGAAAVIYTYDPDVDTGYYSIAPDAFGSNDGLYGYDWAPCVYMPWQNGEWLKSELKRRTVTATVVNDVKVTLQKDGGFGYNVVGTIPGKVKNAPKVVFSAHHDAHFRAGMDDTSGVSQAMTIAKAMRESGYRPNGTVVFMLTTGEEFGYANAYWDFLAGSWYSINNTHASWPGKVAAQINLESQGGRGGRVGVAISRELNAWAQAKTEQNAALIAPNTSRVSTPVSSWTDAFPFNSAGIPAMTFSASGSAYAGRYHTNYDVSSLIGWKFFGKMNKLEFRFARSLDRGLLPYSLGDLADEIAGTVDQTQLEGTGADATTVDTFVNDVAAFQSAAADYEAGKAAIPATAVAASNASLMQIEKEINKGLLSLGPDDDVMWAHEQLVSDLENINTALAALPGDPDAAKTALENVYLMWYGLTFSETPWQTYLAWHEPTAIGYGTTANVVNPIDAVPAYEAIDAADYAAAADALDTLRASEISDLNARLAAMSAVLEEVTPQIQALL